MDAPRTSPIEHPYPAYRAALVAAALAVGCFGAATTAPAGAHRWHEGQEARWQGRRYGEGTADWQRGRVPPGQRRPPPA